MKSMLALAAIIGGGFAFTSIPTDASAGYRHRHHHHGYYRHHHHGYYGQRYYRPYYRGYSYYGPGVYVGRRGVRVGW